MSFDLFISLFILILCCEAILVALVISNKEIIKLGLMDWMEHACVDIQKWTDDFYDKYYTCRPGERVCVNA